MSTGLELLTILEKAGGTLSLDGEQVKVTFPRQKRDLVTPILTRLRRHREEVARLLQERSARTTGALAIPQGAILVAPRFDSKPLTQIPQCWCCRISYKVDWIQEWENKKYAWLEPGCRCLDTAQAINCCGFCVTHCNCRK